MIQFNRSMLKRYAEFSSINELANRAVGRSSRRAMMFLIEAIDNPGMAVKIEDHPVDGKPPTRIQNDNLYEKVRDLAAVLGFNAGWHFSKINLTVINNATERLDG